MHDLPGFAAQTDAGGGDISAVALLWFGGATLGVLAAVQIIRILKDGKFSASFTRLFGILFIVVMGSVLVFVDVTADQKAAAYTLFGTAAGYLASRPGGTKDNSDTV